MAYMAELVGQVRAKTAAADDHDVKAMLHSGPPLASHLPESGFVLVRAQIDLAEFVPGRGPLQVCRGRFEGGIDVERCAIEFLRCQPVPLDFKQRSKQVIGLGLSRVGGNGFSDSFTAAAKFLSVMWRLVSSISAR